MMEQNADDENYYSNQAVLVGIHTVFYVQKDVTFVYTY